MAKLMVLVYSFLVSGNLFARSLKASADKLADDTSRIALGLALFGLIVAGIYFILGKNDASTKVSNALLGIGIVVLAPAIVAFVKGIA